MSKLFVCALVPNIISILIDKRKNIVKKASHTAKCGPNRKYWAYKRRITLTRQPKDIYCLLQNDIPTWKATFGQLMPKHVKYIAKQLEWTDIRLHKTSKVNRILIWIRRLRSACTHDDNSTFFGISASSCQFIFNNVNNLFIIRFACEIGLPKSDEKIILQQILVSVKYFFPIFCKNRRIQNQ